MGHHHHMNHMLSFHHYGGSKKEGGAVLPPKGCMAIRVGQREEEQERFVVPVVYLNHPLFVGLLKEAEEEYGFEHKGAITIPCRPDRFRRVQGIIDRDLSLCGGSGGGAGREHNHHLLPHFHLCLKAS
ncbi:putative auxin-responsive protein SAUR32 [Iris pallida]|uniref:Auxin-responsive protein SAUR32 n=1 Tax=Iris pallida TaxID=29817 RepID=A0AAX6HJ64_IRIPA|nr:putative auxin-responsive protein SAUR32 [Iris pallida]